MASIPLPTRSVAWSWLDEARTRQPLLVSYGLWLVALAVPVLLLGLVDHREQNGASVWLKPAKFLFSVAVFALTTAWFFGCVRPERRRSRPMRGVVGVLIGAGSLEILYIAFQAARGLPSHFNRSSPLYEVLYGVMGVAALLLVGTAAVLAWEIARRPARDVRGDYLLAVVIGLVLCVALGGGLGMYMAQQTGHAVGAVGGKVPLFGWNRSGGDLRIAHFLGIHAQQAIPLMAMIASGLGRPWRYGVVLTGSVIFLAVTLSVFAQAVHGSALVPLLN